MTTTRKTKARRKSTTAKPRRTQAQRRQETTDKILRAAIGLLVDRGYSGFSTIAVASHAKVSRGARENYFKTKYDLIEAAWKAALRRAEIRSRQKAGQTSATADPLGNFLASSRSFFFSDDYIALLELAMAARTDRQIKRIMHVLFKANRKRHDQLWLDAFERAGYAREEVARFINFANCVFRGAAMLSAWGLPPSLYRPAIADLRALAPRPVIAPHAQRASARLRESGDPDSRKLDSRMRGNERKNSATSSSARGQDPSRP